MSLKDLIAKYLNKEVTAVDAIRQITGMFNPDYAVDLLALVNQICRHEQGDLDTETFKSVYGIE